MPYIQQGSQTQIGSGATWDSKKDPEGRIEKVKKKLNFQSNISKIGEKSYFSKDILIFPDILGSHWNLSRAACLRPLFFNILLKPACKGFCMNEVVLSTISKLFCVSLHLLVTSLEIKKITFETSFLSFFKGENKIVSFFFSLSPKIAVCFDRLFVWIHPRKFC